MEGSLSDFDIEMEEREENYRRIIDEDSNADK